MKLPDHLAIEAQMEAIDLKVIAASGYALMPVAEVRRIWGIPDDGDERQNLLLGRITNNDVEVTK